MEQLLQGTADAEFSASVRPRSPYGPMDLVCSRVPRLPHFLRASARRGAGEPGREAGVGATTLDAAAYEYRITLPNPRYPLPAPPIVRHHADQASRAVAAWGADGDAQCLGADLALTVMAAYLPFRMSEHEGAVRARDGTLISRRADRHYRAFNECFLVTMPDEGGVVTEAAVRSWIESRERADERRAA